MQPTIDLPGEPGRSNQPSYGPAAKVVSSFYRRVEISQNRIPGKKVHLNSRQNAHGRRCGATMLMNSRDVITLVFFQNSGKCR